MTYVDNGPAWWTLLLLAVGGGLIALFAYKGAEEVAGWWAAWRRQYRARHRADPIEDATDDSEQAFSEHGEFRKGAFVVKTAGLPEGYVPPSGSLTPPSTDAPDDATIQDAIDEGNAVALSWADPIEDATDDAIEDAAWPTAAETADALVESWSTPLGWAANGRYVHRADCPHMTTGKPITVWSEDAARKWAESTKPRLTGCEHCDPFNAPEPAEAT